MERGTVVVDRPWVRYAYYKTLVLPKLSKEPTQTRMKPFLRIRSEISRKKATADNGLYGLGSSSGLRLHEIEPWLSDFF